MQNAEPSRRTRRVKVGRLGSSVLGTVYAFVIQTMHGDLDVVYPRDKGFDIRALFCDLFGPCRTDGCWPNFLELLALLILPGDSGDLLCSCV